MFGSEILPTDWTNHNKQKPLSDQDNQLIESISLSILFMSSNLMLHLDM